MGLKANIQLEEEVLERLKKINLEVKAMKNYLETLIKLNLGQIKEVKPTLAEKRALKKTFKLKDFVEWEEIKDEI